MKPTRKIQSPIISGILSNVSEAEMRRTTDRMLLADRIASIMRNRGLSQKDLAKRMNKKESEISEWLSGNRNLTVDTLSDLANALGIRFFDFPMRSQRISAERGVVKGRKTEVNTVYLPRQNRRIASDKTIHVSDTEPSIVAI